MARFIKINNKRFKAFVTFKKKSDAQKMAKRLKKRVKTDRIRIIKTKRGFTIFINKGF